jgi:hypothetical protein
MIEAGEGALRYLEPEVVLKGFTPDRSLADSVKQWLEILAEVLGRHGGGAVEENGIVSVHLLLRTHRLPQEPAKGILTNILLAKGWDDALWTVPNGVAQLELRSYPLRAVTVALKSGEEVRACSKQGERPNDFAARLIQNGFSRPMKGGGWFHYPPSEITWIRWPASGELRLYP